MKYNIGSLPPWGLRDEKAENSRACRGHEVLGTVDAAPTARKGGGKVGQTTRKRGTRKTAAKGRTQRNAVPAFLAQRFYPLATEEATVDPTAACRMERDFYASAKNLCSLYGMAQPPRSGLPFPFNLSKELESLRQGLKARGHQVDLRLLETEEKTCLATVQTFSTQSTLFYLPVLPMLNLLDSGKRRQVGELLQSVFAYLLQVVGVPHFASDYGYLGGIYEMLSDWWSEDGYAEDEGERLVHEAFFEQLWHDGELSLHLLSEKSALLDFGQRVGVFKAESEAERNFLKTAADFLELYRDYPERSIGASISEPFGAEEHDGIIRWEQYLHFFYGFGQLVQDQFLDCINAELNECSLMEEPRHIQFFDTPQVEVMEVFGFEQRLFELLHLLCDHLNEL